MYDKHRHLAVVDLEATCDDGGRLPRTEMEIIEIGAVMVEGAGLTPVSEFQSFVKPVRHPALTTFCTALTSITQSDVDDAPSFAAVATRLEGWLADYEDVVFCSWGDYDRLQVQQDCDYHAVANPFPKDHLNLKRLFSDKQGATRKLGMEHALRRVGLTLDGTHHRGIDDARNITRLLPFCLDLAH